MLLVKDVVGSIQWTENFIDGVHDNTTNTTAVVAFLGEGDKISPKYIDIQGWYAGSGTGREGSRDEFNRGASAARFEGGSGGGGVEGGLLEKSPMDTIIRVRSRAY